MMNFHILRGAFCVVFNGFGYLEVLKLQKDTPDDPLRERIQALFSTCA